MESLPVVVALYECRDRWGMDVAARQRKEVIAAFSFSFYNQEPTPYYLDV